MAVKPIHPRHRPERLAKQILYQEMLVGDLRDFNGIINIANNRYTCAVYQMDFTREDPRISLGEHGLEWKDVARTLAVQLSSIETNSTGKAPIVARLAQRIRLVP